MNLFGTKRFWRGVHVPEHKEQTAHHFLTLADDGLRRFAGMLR